MHVLSYLEYLATNGVSAHQLANHISASKARFMMFGSQLALWDHRNVHYLDLSMLHHIVIQCENMYLGQCSCWLFLAF